MNEIKNSIKENITVSIPKILFKIVVIIASIIGFKKGKTTKTKVFSCITGAATLINLGLDIEKNFIPIEDEEDSEEEI